MWSQSGSAKHEIERRYEFVSAGAQDARQIVRAVRERLAAYRDRLSKRVRMPREDHRLASTRLAPES
jgi:hypothetical protein